MTSIVNTAETCKGELKETSTFRYHLGLKFNPGLAFGMFTDTKHNALLGMLQILFPGQEMWMGKLWKHFGHPSTLYPPQHGEWLPPIGRKCWTSR